MKTRYSKLKNAIAIELKEIKESIWFNEHPIKYKYGDLVLITSSFNDAGKLSKNYWGGIVKKARYHKAPTGWKLIYDVDTGENLSVCHSHRVYSIAEESLLKELGYKESN